MTNVGCLLSPDSGLDAEKRVVSKIQHGFYLQVLKSSERAGMKQTFTPINIKLHTTLGALWDRGMWSDECISQGSELVVRLGRLP